MLYDCGVSEHRPMRMKTTGLQTAASAHLSEPICELDKATERDV